MITEKLPDFIAGTTWEFVYEITLDGDAPDITDDTVTVTLKSNINDPDSAALLQVNADVTTSGADGKAIYAIPPATTDITGGKYYYDVMWYPLAGKERIIDSGEIIVKPRVSDIKGP